MENKFEFENSIENEQDLRATKPAGEFQLYCEIVKFDIQESSREESILLKIDFYSYLSKKEWSTIRKLNDFIELYSILEKFFVNVPKLPQKVGLFTKVFSELNQKKTILNEFLQILISRPDLISNVYVIKFLQLENHFADFNIFQPFMLYNIEETQNEILTMDYDSKTSLLFIGCVNKTFGAKISNYFSKIKLFSSNINNEEKGISQLIIYNIIKNNSGQIHMEPLHLQYFKNELCYLKYFENKDGDTNNVLVIGFTNGTIEILKIFVNESNNIARDFIESLCTIKFHKKPIIGVAINFTIGYVYSIAKENILNIAELNYQSLIRSIPITKKDINNYFYDEENLRLYLTDELGSIWIVSLMNSLQPKILQAFHTKTPFISCLNIDLVNRYLFLGNSKGYLQVFELIDEDPKNINLIRKCDINLDNNLRITTVAFTIRNELLISLSNGSIAVFSHEEENPEFVIDAHLKEISKFFWDDKRKILITGSHDKGIKIFQLPLYWPSELVRKYKSKNNIKILLANINNKNEEKYSNDEFELTLERLKIEDNKNPFDEKSEEIINQEPVEKNENLKNNEENYGNKEDINTETPEDDDFLILKSVAKLKNELSEIEKNCEDLYGWDEDF